MTTKHPRLAISLQPQHKVVYEEIAQLLGVPTSSFIASMLVEATPNMRTFRDGLKKDKLKGMSTMLDNIKTQVDEKQLDIDYKISEAKK